MKNNKGLSLIELIVVIALMAIVGTITLTSFQLLTGQEAKKFAENLSAALDKGKVYAMTKSGNVDAYLQIIKKPDGYYAEYYIPENPLASKAAGEWILYENSKIGRSDVTMICSFDSAGERMISDGVKLSIHFNRLNGAFEKAKIEGTTTEELLCESISIKKGKTYKLELVSITGKHTLKRID